MVVEFTIWWILPLILIGFTIGLLVSIFGGGGGFFYVPLLTLVFQVPTQYAVATSLASIIPTTILGSLGHYRQGNLDVPLGLIFGVGGIVGAFFGAFASGMIPPPLMGKLFGIFMIVLSIPMLFSARRRAGAGTGESPPASRPLTAARAVEGTAFGIVSGAMAGLFGVSGTPPVIAGLYLIGAACCKSGWNIHIRPPLQRRCRSDRPPRDRAGSLGAHPLPCGGGSYRGVSWTSIPEQDKDTRPGEVLRPILHRAGHRPWNRHDSGVRKSGRRSGRAEESGFMRMLQPKRKAAHPDPARLACAESHLTAGRQK